MCMITIIMHAGPQGERKAMASTGERTRDRPMRVR